MSSLKENKAKVINSAIEFNERQKEIDSDDRMMMIYSDRDLMVFEKRVTRQNGNVWITLTSTVHWSKAVTIQAERVYPDKKREVTMSYGSGGTISAPAEMIAKAMAVVFTHSQKVIKNLESEISRGD